MLKKKKKDIKIKKQESSLQEFIERPIASDEEIEEFEEKIDEAIDDSIEEEEEEDREEAIEEGLNEIYQDENGDIVDVGQLDIKKKRGFIFMFFSFIFLLGIMAGVGYGAYYYIFHTGLDVTAVDFEIMGKEKVLAGEEFFYTVKLKNLSNAPLQNMRVELKYPDNFVFLDSSPMATQKNNMWNLKSLMARGSEEIKIKGQIIGQVDESSIIHGTLFYVPQNFSSEFKKDTSFIAEIKGVGLDFVFDYPSTVLVGEENEIILSLEQLEESYINNFNLEINELENLEILDIKLEKKDDESEELTEEIKIEKLKDNIWNINSVGEEKQNIVIVYKINEKIDDKINLLLRFFNEIIVEEDENKLYFYEENISQEVMNSDLNLTIIINGSKSDQAVNFGDTLNYSISYTNKGESTMKDLVIMAVLESNFLKRSTLEDENSGQEKGNTIIWSKMEIPQLAELNPDEEGVIDFSIEVSDFKESDLGKDFEIKNYSQYSMGEVDGEIEVNEDNKSNTIVNKINSDLSLKEEIRYFNEDNIPVGTGPLPPKVGEETSFKAYWTINNNLHELGEVSVEAVLPEGVTWNGKERMSVGTISYDEQNRKIVWNIGRLPITVYRADSEFSISITPREDDRNKIMVLSSGAIVQAIDKETEATISKTTKTQTTKLEDDEISKDLNSGVVE